MSCDDVLCCQMGALVETWISKANGTQRKGRAGRVREGQCYRLYSESKWESLANHQVWTCGLDMVRCDGMP